jgi:hypothetical protein
MQLHVSTVGRQARALRSLQPVRRVAALSGLAHLICSGEPVEFAGTSHYRGLTSILDLPSVFTTSTAALQEYLQSFCAATLALCSRRTRCVVVEQHNSKQCWTERAQNT